MTIMRASGGDPAATDPEAVGSRRPRGETLEGLQGPLETGRGITYAHAATDRDSIQGTRPI